MQESNSKLKEDHDFMAKELTHIEEEKQARMLTHADVC
jgi:hypothetical protein